MGRNDYLSIMEVRLFTPFRYESSTDDVAWMLIGAPATKMGNHFIGIKIDRGGGFYCGTVPSTIELLEPARDASPNDFLKKMLSEWNYNQEQIVAFMIGMGKDGRRQDKLEDFS